MDINVKINRLVDKNGLKAMATIDLDNMIQLTNIRVIQGEYGLFIGYPQLNESNLVEFKEGEDANKLKKEIQKSVVDRYKEAVKDNSIVGYGNNYTDDEKDILKDLAKDNLDKLEVNINPKNAYGKQKASGEITIDNLITLKGIRIMSTEENELFVAMPSESYEKDGEKKYRELFYGLTADVKKCITEKAVSSYSQNLESLEDSLQENEEEPEI